MSAFLIQPDENGTCCGCDIKTNPCGVCGGACCYNDGTCDIQSQEDCETSGGEYQGDASICDTCNVCPIVTLQCDSINAFGSKPCGFTNSWNAPNTSKYRNLDCSYADAETNVSGCDHSGDPPVPVTFTSSFNYSGSLYMDGCTARCSNGTVECGTYSATSGTSGCPGPAGFPASDTTTGGSWGYIGAPAFGCQGFSTSINYTQTIGSNETSITYSRVYIGLCDGCSHTESLTYFLSGELTTEFLISSTEDSLPAYFGNFGCDESEEIGFRTDGQNCVCFASSALASDESTYSIVRFKPRFSLDEEAEIDFQIDYNEHFEPESSSELPFDVPRSLIGSAGDLYVDGEEVFEPASNGTVTITDITVRCNFAP